MSKLCSNCGAECEDDAKFCRECGNSFVVNEGAQGYNATPFFVRSSDIGFLDAFIKFWQNYAVFSGRARRKEYWYMVLWNMLIGVVVSIIGAAISESLGDVLYTVYGIAGICPWIALTFRRLHDTGKSGVYLLFSLIPIVGFIIMLVFLATDSDRYENQYGKSPKYEKPIY